MNTRLRGTIIYLVVAITLIFIFTACGNKLGVKVLKAEKRTIEAFASANGVVEAEQMQEVVFASTIKVNDVLVREGDYVTSEQRLMLYNSDKIERSTMDGVVTEVNVRRGVPYNSSKPAIVIMDTTSLIVKANVRQSDSPNVRIGQPVSISGDSIPKEKGLTGKVDFIADVAKSIGDQSFIEIKVKIDGKVPDYLKHGMKVSCDIKLASKSDALLITYDCVKPIGSDKYIYVVKNGRLEERKISIGAESGIDIEVKEGIAEGELVVLDPRAEFKSGLEVEVLK